MDRREQTKRSRTRENVFFFMSFPPRPTASSFRGKLSVALFRIIIIMIINICRGQSELCLRLFKFATDAVESTVLYGGYMYLITFVRIINARIF